MRPRDAVAVGLLVVVGVGFIAAGQWLVSAETVGAAFVRVLIYLVLGLAVAWGVASRLCRRDPWSYRDMHTAARQRAVRRKGGRHGGTTDHRDS